jgi:hypothetical protein
MSKLRPVIVGCLFALVLGFGLLLGVLLPRLAGVRGPAKIYTTSTVLRQVQTLSQLVTVKYVLEKVVILEDTRWYGESRVLLVAHGIVKAGVDLQQLKSTDLRMAEKSVRISLPPAVITDVYLDDDKTEVIERNTGLLRRFDKDLEQNARRLANDEMRRAARNGGILADANERARLQLTLFFQQLGFEEV